MNLNWYGMFVAVIDDSWLSAQDLDAEVDRYRTAGRIVRRRVRTVKKWLPPRGAFR